MTAAVAAWTGPALLAILAGRTLAGDADAPFLAVALVVAPLVALCRRPAPDARGLPAGLALAASVGLVLWAHFLVLADALGALGAARWQVLAVAAAAAALAAHVPPGAGWRAGLPLAAAALLVLAVAAVGAGLGLSPHAAWGAAASRAALVFGPASPAVTDGAVFSRGVTLAFTEAHRVGAAGPGVFRVVEHEPRGSTVREWRLGAGDALTLRAGDALVVEAGARVRFEAGKRVPGAPPSGAEWAEPAARAAPGALAGWLGALVTLLGGALALVAPVRATRLAALAAPLLATAPALVAVAWGVYAVSAAPELALAATAAEPLVRLPSLALGEPRGTLVAVAVAAALLGLFVAAAWALRERVRGVAGGLAPFLWAGLCVAAAVAALWPADPWRVAQAGLGLAAAAWAAPALGARGARALDAGAVAAGALAFAALAAGGAWLPDWLGVLARHPALGAAPLAWALAAASRGAGGWQERAPAGQ
jgi:hypothetical protein